jgi:outer membrane protein TolC
MKYLQIKKSIIIFVLVLPLTVFGQTGKINLDYCLQKALENAPERNIPALNGEISDLKTKNIETNYLPSLNVNGQASYQSDVTKVPIPPLPQFNMEPIDKDWYKLNINLSQMIWDGGYASAMKKVEQSNLKLSNGETDIKLYNIKEQVIRLFFSALLMRDNISVLKITAKNIDEQISDGEKAVDNGMMLIADLNALKVEKKLLEQSIIKTSEEAKGILGALSQITGETIADITLLEKPSATDFDFGFVNNRPDFKLLSLQQNHLETLKEISSVKRMPKFVAFGQAGYGRPGYDMLNNNFDTYFMVGLKLNWQIYDWNKVKHEKQILSIQNNIIDLKKERINQNLKAELEKQKAEIDKFEKLIESDNQIIELQQTVVDKASSQLKNGTLTPTNYLLEVNKLAKLQMQEKAHKLQLLYAKYMYITLMGNL